MRRESTNIWRISNNQPPLPCFSPSLSYAPFKAGKSLSLPPPLPLQMWNSFPWNANVCSLQWMVGGKTTMTTQTEDYFELNLNPDFIRHPMLNRNSPRNIFHAVLVGVGFPCCALNRQILNGGDCESPFEMKSLKQRKNVHSEIEDVNSLSVDASFVSCLAMAPTTLGGFESSVYKS